MFNFLQKFGLTRQEIVIIFFLLLIFTGGIIISALKWKPDYNSNYEEKDKIFRERTMDAFANLEKNKLTDEQQKNADKLKLTADSLLAEKEKVKDSDIKSVRPDRKININTSYAADLIILPGIGESTAEKIIEYREHTGKFKRIEEIMNVKGIGKKKFELIKEYITVE